MKAPAENADDRERRILQKRVYDAGAGKSVSTDSAPVPAELGAQITELLNRFDLRPFDEYSVLYEAGREPGEAPAFADADDGIKLCVFYEDGDQLYFELTAASDIALIRPLTEALRDYFEIQFASIQ